MRITFILFIKKLYFHLLWNLYGQCQCNEMGVESVPSNCHSSIWLVPSDPMWYEASRYHPSPVLPFYLLPYLNLQKNQPQNFKLCVCSLFSWVTKVTPMVHTFTSKECKFTKIYKNKICLGALFRCRIWTSVYNLSGLNLFSSVHSKAKYEFYFSVYLFIYFIFFISWGLGLLLNFFVI